MERVIGIEIDDLKLVDAPLASGEPSGPAKAAAAFREVAGGSESLALSTWKVAP
jgi:hypothetical protein